MLADQNLNLKWTALRLIELQINRAPGSAKEGDSVSEIDLAAGANGTNHTTFAPDAFRVARMNLSSGGGQSRDMRGGWDPLAQQSQPMHTWVQGRKVAKGIQKVLEERGLWGHGKKLKLDTLQS